MRSLRFQTQMGTPTPGTLEYSYHEYSFHFEPSSWNLFRKEVLDDGAASLLIGTLQLEVALSTGVFLFVSGYHPWVSWVEKSIVPPDPRPGAVFVVADREFTDGAAVRLTAVGEWTTAYDRSSGWVRVTADLESEDEQVVLIAEGTSLGLIGDQLNSVWLHPIFDGEQGKPKPA
jgi:hypothetical protein